MQITELCNVKGDIRLNMRFPDVVVHPLGAGLLAKYKHNSNQRLCQNLILYYFCSALQLCSCKLSTD